MQVWPYCHKNGPSGPTGLRFCGLNFAGPPQIFGQELEWTVIRYIGRLRDTIFIQVPGQFSYSSDQHSLKWFVPFFTIITALIGTDESNETPISVRLSALETFRI